MHQLVRDYLDTKAAEKSSSTLKKKNELLIELGLFEKVYSDKDEVSDEFPYSEWDDKTGNTHYYKQVPVAVTDEEYSEILKYQKQDPKSRNTISMIFTVLAYVVFIAGFILGIGFGGHDSPGAILLYWAAFFVAGVILLGFAEIIQLLTDIKNK